MRRGIALAIWLLVLLALLACTGLLVGARALPPAALLDAALGRGDEEARIILLQPRAPRLLIGALVGAALGLAGAIIQAVTRNPLGDPGLLGINAGAGLAIVLGVGWFGAGGMGATVMLAAVGAAMAALAVQYVAGAGGRSDASIRLTLAGVAVAALCFGLTQGLALTDPERFDFVRNWRVGSLAGDGRLILPGIVPALMAGGGLAAVLAPRLNALMLGDDRAAALGLSLAATRILALLAVVLLAGGATAAAGPVAFVGLAAPHAARRLVGADQRAVLLIAGLIGAALVVSADIVGRVAAAPAEVPVGIVTALLGAPVLIALVRLDRRLRA